MAALVILNRTFITPGEGCVLVFACVCAHAHSLIDPVVSQCNRSFIYMAICKMIDNRMCGRENEEGRVRVRQARVPQLKNTIGNTNTHG